MLVYKSDSPKKFLKYNTAKFVVVPAPYEKTTSYGRGTKNGPRAICEASSQVELYDEELLFGPYSAGIHTLGPVTTLAKLEGIVAGILRDRKIPIVLGGEHAISSAPILAIKKFYPDLSVVQFDAHADLRDTFEGTPLNHACVMRRVYEAGVPFVQIGIRNLSVEEAEFIKKNKLELFYAKDIHSSSNWMDKAISRLSNDVYLTFDVDVFDPSIIPATGTPEPGGLNWYQIVDFFKRLAATKRIVGADFVELAPRRGDPSSDFTVAKLVYKLIGYISR